MSLLFFDGFFDCQNCPKPEWNLSGSAFSNVTGRDGSTNGGMGFNGHVSQLVFPTPAATLFMGFATTVGSSQGNSAALYSFDTSGGQQMYLGITSTGFIQMRRANNYNTSVIGTTSGHTPIVLNGATWYYIEVKWIPHTSAGTVVVKLNGVTVLTVTGAATSSATADAYGFTTSPGNNFGGSQWSTDDLYVCDAVDATATQGRAYNDFLGDLKVATLLPTAAGDLTQLTASTGSNWSCVDENPINTSDYVSSTAASGNRDLYTMNDLPSGAQAVYGVRATVYAQKTDAGTAAVKPVIKENSTVTAQASIPLSTTWLPLSGPMLTKRPSDSAVFTVTDVNNLQAGVEAA